MLPEQQQRILGYFIEEAKDHLNTIEQGLLNLQATIVNPEMANEVFRAAHSVKGGAAMLGIESMQRTSHRMEDYFKLLKEAPIKVDRSLESMFLRVFDALQELLEQLQGPFGLTSDKEESIMAGVEPVFQQLQEHLDKLVAEADTQEVLATEVTPVTFTTRAPQPVEESALKLVFSSDVSATLREMLARFKQTDTDETRSALEACCQLLERFGEQFNLPTWMNLVKHARWAVCDRNNDYRTLAPVLIKEIKKAQDLVLASREPEINLSDKLQTLAAQGDMADVTNDLDSLFADNAPDITSSVDNTLSDTTSMVDDKLSDLDPLDFDDNLEASSSTTDEGIPLDDLLNDAASSPSGPEVGAAELTSLADLFEAGGDDLDSDWQEEELPLNEGATTASFNIDIAPDFEDLLTDDASEFGANQNDFESGSELADLFDDSDSTETVDNLDTLDSGLDALTGQTDTSVESVNINLAESIDSPIEDLFDEVETDSDSSDVDELFDDLDLSTENDIQESSLELNNVATDGGSDVDDELFSDLDLSTETVSDPENEVTTEETDSNVDELFGDLDLSTENDIQESSLELNENLGALNELTSPEITNSDELANIDLAFEDISPISNGDNDGLSDNQTDIDTAAPVTDSFFSEIETPASPGSADSSDTETKESEFDDFFSIDEDTPVPSETPASDPFSDGDLWETNSSSTSDTPTPNSQNDLADDIWADPSQLADSPDTAVGSEIFTEQVDEIASDSDVYTSTQSEAIEDLALDDVWASVDDVTSEDMTSEMAEQSEEEQSEADIASTDIGLDDLFDAGESNIESSIDLHQSTADASLDEGLGDLFGDSDNIDNAPESGSGLDDLFSDTDIPSETSIDSDLADLAGSSVSLDLDEVPEATDLGIELGNTDERSSTESEILNEPPSTVFELDLLDIEDDGIVTGFVTDDEDLDIDEESAEIQASHDLFAQPNNPSPDNQGLESLDSLLSEPPAEIDEGITSSDNQGLESLDSLLSELPAEIDEGVTSPDSNNTDTDSGNEFGELEALIDNPDDSAISTPAFSPDTNIDTDIDDEFGDLEALLQDTDQTLATASASASSYRPTSNRLSARRMMTDQTMRVSVSHLDNLSNLVGELVVNRNTLEQDQERLRQFLDNLLFQVQQLNDVGQRMRDLYERSLLESSLISSRQSYQMASTPGIPVERSDSEGHATGESFDALEMDRFTGFHTLSQEMIELIVRVRESASDIAYTVESSDQVTRQFRQVTNQLQEGLNKARMVPFAQTASRLPRAVRDISLKCGKEARLVVEGRDILIDKMILEQLYDPMTHLVNNAITHGVETPDERRAAGKAPEGLITVRAFYQGNQTVISVGDDGAGIDPNVVKRKALQKGLISQADIETMTVLDVYDLLFHPGFSTRDQADDFAGRGFGMDVVRTSLADIRGNITIDSELGRGTNFTIRLPLTLSISKALSCISNQARIAFPMDGVEDMFDVSRERIQKDDQDQDCILWRDTLLPFQNLSDLLSFNRTLGRGRVYGGNQDENMISIVVLRSATSFIALEVDQVLGEQEIVIKQLEGPVPKPTGIAGATVLGDGRVMPIADGLELIDLALGRVRREPNAALWAQSDEAPPEEPTKVKSEPTVLIVDDSITVRELLSMSFNKVGYRVEQARDGQEAWEKLRSGLPCDLVFCDIEMPRMDGLELLSRLQKDDGLQQIPIAMLTSRGADRHRQMAVDLGASGYFTKPYLEEALLDAANKMLHGEKLA